MISTDFESIYFDKALFDNANVFDELSYDDFLNFNYNNFKGPFYGPELQTILRVVCATNRSVYDETIIPKFVFVIAGIPVYVFEHQLPVSPQFKEAQLRAGATFVPKLGLMIIAECMSQDIFYHEIIHAYQYMLDCVGKLPKYYFSYDNNPFKRLLNIIQCQFLKPNEKIRVRINHIFLNVRKEVHAYQVANHGTLTDCSMELCITRLTSKNYALLVRELEEKNISWLISIVHIMILCNKNILNPIQQQQVISKILLTADYQEYLDWQNKFLADVDEEYINLI